MVSQPRLRECVADHIGRKSPVLYWDRISPHRQGIAGALWAPQSLPRSADADVNAVRREGKWLPWVVAVQGGLVSLGVFLGVWAAQGSEAWTYFLVAGFGALTALIMVTLGFVSLYRFVILASHTIPAEAITTSGVRP